MAQHGRALGILIGEQVFAIGVVHRDVNVHARTCLFGKWLGHECSLQPVCLCHRFHHALVHDGIIAGTQHVGLVSQGKFALPRRKFRNRGFERQTLNIAGLVEFIKERTKIVEFAEAIHFDHFWCLIVISGPRGANRSVACAFRIEQVKFQFHRKRRCQTHFSKTVHYQPKNMARIQIMRLTIQLVKIDHKLRGIVARPRRFDQSSGDWLHRPVSVTVFPYQPGFDSILAGYVDHSNRSREKPSDLVNRQYLMLPQPLAPRDSAHVGVDHLDGIGSGIGGKKGFRLAARCYDGG